MPGQRFEPDEKVFLQQAVIDQVCREGCLSVEGADEVKSQYEQSFQKPLGYRDIPQFRSIVYQWKRLNDENFCEAWTEAVKVHEDIARDSAG